MLVTNLYISFVIIIFTPLLGKIIKKSYDLYILNKKFKSGNTLLELLNRLTPREFEIWSREYLSSIGYTNVILTAPSPDEGRNIICTKNSNTVYVKCKSNTTENSITHKDIEMLLGAMISDNIKKGLIITTNLVSDSACELINNLQPPYSIHIINFDNSQKQPSDYIIQTN